MTGLIFFFAVLSVGLVAFGVYRLRGMMWRLRSPLPSDLYRPPTTPPADQPIDQDPPKPGA